MQLADTTLVHYEVVMKAGGNVKETLNGLEQAAAGVGIEGKLLGLSAWQCGKGQPSILGHTSQEAFEKTFNCRLKQIEMTAPPGYLPDRYTDYLAETPVVVPQGIEQYVALVRIVPKKPFNPMDLFASVKSDDFR